MIRLPRHVSHKTPTLYSLSMRSKTLPARCTAGMHAAVLPVTFPTVLPVPAALTPLLEQPFAAMNPVGVRWAVDIGDWTPEEPETAFLASLLPSNERAAVAAYVRPTDARRALVSRLLQRACVSTVLGIPFDCVQIKTTRGKKPFAANRASERKCAVDAPNFNYNVTHEGRYVCIAAETHLLVGADVAAPREARGGAAGGAAGSAGRTNAGGNTTAAHSHAIGGGGGALLGGALQRFAGCFAPCEWRLLHSAPHDEQRTEATFQRLWSLKEVRLQCIFKYCRFNLVLRCPTIAAELEGWFQGRLDDISSPVLHRPEASVKPRGDGLGDAPRSALAAVQPPVKLRLYINRHSKLLLPCHMRSLRHAAMASALLRSPAFLLYSSNTSFA